jgi:hypothetical protein
MEALDISAVKLSVFCCFVTIDRILFTVFTDDVTAAFRVRFFVFFASLHEFFTLLSCYQ